MRAAGRRRGPVASAAAATAAILLLGCSAPERRVDLSGSEVVSFASTDGVELEGRLFGDGTAAVILSHMRPADQTSWYPFATRLADADYLVLTYNFRGYCPGGEGGCSSGELDVGAIWQDVLGAIEFVAERGATSVSLVGASMGGTASLVAASRPGVDVRAVVSLSAPASIEGLVVDGAVLSNVTAAKLFIAGVGDAQAARDAEALYERSPPPKRVEIVPADDHGTDLLSGPRAEDVRRLIEVYLPPAGGP
jgi:pimeloyl-ACP methyl ester carboxylesterase